MNNTIEFILRMKDMMSSNITKVSSNSQSAFNKMSKSADQVTGRNKILGMSFNELQKQIRDVENTISRSTIPSQIASARRELAALQRMSTKHAGSPLTPKGGTGGGIGIGGVAIGSMLGGAGMMAVNAIGSGISTMITKSMEKEQAITGLTTFLGKQGATQAFKNIRKDANDTSYSSDSLLAVNGALISTGKINAANARTDTMNLANAISATNPQGGDDALKRMAINMQQIKNVGYAQGEDIKQFSYAGMNMAEMLKRSGQRTDGKITYEMISKALAAANSKGGMFEGALKAQSQTMGGKWSTVKDNFMTAASDIGDAFSPVINKLLDLGIKFANWISSSLAQAQPYIDAISNTIGVGVDYIMQMVNGTSEWSGWIELLKNHFGMVWEFTKSIGIKLWQMVVRIMEFVKHSEILKDAFRFIGWVMEKVGGIILFVMDSVIFLWDHVLEPILSKLEAVYRWIKGTSSINVKGTHTLITPKKPKPEDNPKNSPLGVGGSLAATNAASGKTAGETVAGAGPKVVNIHVGKFFDNLQFTTMNAGESANEIERIVMECFARVVYNGSKMV